jgi:thiamine-monophosphate kinase
MSDEFSRIEEIKRRLLTDSNEVQITIGDDGAVLTPSDASQILSVDAQVEGIHFCRDFATWNDIGYRSFVAALSDLAAMGAQPRVALVSLILPIEFADNDLYCLIDGISEAATAYRSPVVGGNLSAGAQMSITTTVIGQSRKEALTRNGARPGDAIYLTGRVGRAALGLRCLQNDKEARGIDFVHCWRRPRARIAEGLKLARLASAAIDISDGLLQDLSHVCRASNVNAEINSDAIPLDETYCDLAKELGHYPLALALTGGEDYELLFTAPRDTPIEGLGTRIGRIVEGTGKVVVLDERKRVLTFKNAGYRHWQNK